MPSSHGSAGPKRGRSLFWFIRVILLTFLVLAAVFNFRVLSGFQSLQASRVSASQAPLPAVPGLDSAPSTSDQIQNSAENTLFGPTDAATSDGAVEFAKNSVPDQSRSEPGAPALSPPVLVAAGQTSDTLASGGPAVAPVGEAAPPVTDRKGLPLPVKRVRRTRLADTTPAPMKLGITDVLPVRTPVTPEPLRAGQISADNQVRTTLVLRVDHIFPPLENPSG